MKKEEKRDIVVKFGGQEHAVEINTYTNVLINYANILTEVSKALEVDNPVKVYIHANNEGSLEAVISVVVSSFGLLPLVAENIDVVSDLMQIIDTSISVLKLKKELQKSEKIININIGDNAKVGDVIINTDSGPINTDKRTYNAYKNPKIAGNTNELFQTLSDDVSVENFKLIGESEQQFEAESDEFSAIANAPNIEDENTRHATLKKQIMYVIKPNFESTKTNKWTFVYNNVRVGANILDSDFLDKVSSGEVSFRSGTTLCADLDIVQEKLKDSDAWLNKKHTIIKVHNISNPPRQMEIAN